MKLVARRRRYSQVVRAEAAEETGRRIVEAFIGRLMGQWYDEITLAQVAKDAGVTVQTMVRRFGGKEGLLVVAAKELGERINAAREAPPEDVGRVVESLMGDYERTGDGVIRLLSLEGRYPAIQVVMEFGRGEHRRWVAKAFSQTLGMIGGKGRERALDLLVIATDVYTWKLLRRDMGRSVAEATATVRSMIEAMIFGATGNNK